MLQRHNLHHRPESFHFKITRAQTADSGWCTYSRGILLRGPCGPGQAAGGQGNVMHFDFPVSLEQINFHVGVYKLSQERDHLF